MNLLYLKYAVAIAKAGSVNKAAEELYVAQSNLSRAIKELESQLGIAVFTRKPNGMELTPEGERFVQYAKSILRQMDEVENMFRDGRRNKQVLSVSVPRASYLSCALADFSEALAETEACDVFYKETNTQRTLRNVLTGDYKMGIIRYAAQYESYFREELSRNGLCHEVLAEFTYRILAGQNSPLAEKTEIHYEDLRDMIEIAHADPYVPSLPMSEVRKTELPEDSPRRIFVFERASQVDILSQNPKAFMWVSPVPPETLRRYGLVERPSPDNTRLYRDVLIYPDGYRLTALDKRFIQEVCKARRRVIKDKE